MKIFYTILIIFFSLTNYAETNAEIRNAVQGFIDTQVLPQDMGDGVTTLTDIKTSSRGIVYIYSLAASQDSLPDITALSSSQSKVMVSMLCTNAMLNWYKINDVEMSYIYYDQSDNLVTLFKISSKDC
tara:strand:+ start:73 stop:456 length:384 start_codon:yes stop_codon:yes gene_type:complete